MKIAVGQDVAQQQRGVELVDQTVGIVPCGVTLEGEDLPVAGDVGVAEGLRQRPEPGRIVRVGGQTSELDLRRIGVRRLRLQPEDSAALRYLIECLDDDGYLTITDRKSDVIIRGGENISAVELEETLLALSGVAEAVVVAAPV